MSLDKSNIQVSFDSGSAPAAVAAPTAPVEVKAESMQSAPTGAVDEVKEPVKAEGSATAEVTENASEGSEDSGKSKHDPYKGFRKQIDKLTARNYAKDTDNQQLRQENAQIKAQLNEALNALKTRDYSGLEGDDRIIAKAKDSVRIEQMETQQRQMQAAEQQSASSEWNQRVEAVKERYPDYKEVMDSFNVPAHPMLIETIKESDIGPDIAYFLGTHQDVAQRLSRATPITVAKELLAIETMLKNNLYTDEPVATSSAKPAISATPAPRSSQSVGSQPVKHWEKPIDDFINKFRSKRR